MKSAMNALRETPPLTAPPPSLPAAYNTRNHAPHPPPPPPAAYITRNETLQ